MTVAVVGSVLSASSRPDVRCSSPQPPLGPTSSHSCAARTTSRARGPQSRRPVNTEQREIHHAQIGYRNARRWGGRPSRCGGDVRRGDHRGGGRTFSVFATTSPDRIAILPVVPGKFSLGDRVIFSDDLLTARGGTAVGTDGAECTTVRITNAATASGTLQCLVTFSLPGGQITTQALNTVTNGQFTTGTQIGAITGGTDTYRDASGQFAVDILSETEANITFFLDD